MSDNRSNGKQRRAESREKRRAQGAREQAGERSDEASGSDTLHAARTAAAAAALGAAVGAARAIAARTDQSSDQHGDDAPLQSEPSQDEPSQDEQEDSSSMRATRAREPEPEAAPAPRSDPARNEQDVRPRTGASAKEASAVVRRAREQLRDLHGSEPESVSSLERTPDGWRVVLEVVEVRRVPDSTDVLAAYEVELDNDGDLLGYRRVRRYYRAQADSDGEGQ
jgi:gas vesicle protein GvpO